VTEECEVTTINSLLTQLLLSCFLGAAQQIMLAIFYTLTPLADSLNLTAQSFIPSAHEDRKGVGGVKFLR